MQLPGNWQELKAKGSFEIGYGDLIGLQGNTGNCWTTTRYFGYRMSVQVNVDNIRIFHLDPTAGSHLHWEVRVFQFDSSFNKWLPISGNNGFIDPLLGTW